MCSQAQLTSELERAIITAVVRAAHVSFTLVWNGWERESVPWIPRYTVVDCVDQFFLHQIHNVVEIVVTPILYSPETDFKDENENVASESKRLCTDYFSMGLTGNRLVGSQFKSLRL